MGGLSIGEPVEDETRWAPGDTVVLREIWRDRVWFARPAIVVSDLPEMTMFHVPSGVRFWMPVGETGDYLKVYTDDWRLAEDIWESSDSALSFAFPDTPYAVILAFDKDRALQHYYINIQAPMRRTATGFDTVEYLLDVVIAADRSTWAWKDEDELQEAVDRSVFSPDDAEWFHHWGERAVEHVLLGEPPFDRDWGGWRPEPSWEIPKLPKGWDTTPIGARPRVRS
jgi:protein associated with RNAse G/E